MQELRASYQGSSDTLCGVKQPDEVIKFYRQMHGMLPRRKVEVIENIFPLLVID